MSALGKHAAANACGTCRKAVEAGGTVVHEECAARAVLLSAPDYPDYEDLLDLTDDERLALPARFHTPQFDSLGRPNMWQCRVCWGDGWVTQWPCKAAQENGTQVFTHAFVDDSVNELAALRARVAELEALPSRAAVLREAADAIVADNDRQLWATKPGKHWAADLLRRMADGKPPRQPEDPHDGPLHHDYALGRDLPAIPHQTTGRCPKGHTFEDCTCGGTA